MCIVGIIGGSGKSQARVTMSDFFLFSSCSCERRARTLAPPLTAVVSPCMGHGRRDLATAKADDVLNVVAKLRV